MAATPRHALVTLIAPPQTLVKRVLEVYAGESELALPELATLAIGDVIKLDRRLEDPALVKLGAGAPLCAGHLGTDGNHKAVQLAALHDRKEA